MKKILALMMAFWLTASFPAAADMRPLSTPEPLTGYTLRQTDELLTVFATRSVKANIAGRIAWDTPDVYVLEVQGEWCCVTFPASYGTGYGYLPLSCFDVAPKATPTPAPYPEFAVGAEGWVLNSGEGYRLNLRDEPSPTARSLGKYYTGTPVTLTGKVTDGYAQVLLAGTTIGWLDVRFLTLDGQGFVPELPTVTIKNRGSGANLRSGPASAYSRLGWYGHGTEVIILGVRADGWYHVMVDEKVGYIAESMLSGSFRFDYGTDSDDPRLTDNMADGSAVCYLNTRTAGGQLHLRKEASTSAKSLGLFYTGTPATVISYTRTGWAYVRIGHLEGYMDADYLAAQKPAQLGETRIIRNTRADGLNLRALPSTGAEVLTFLDNYTQLTVLGELTDGWCYVLHGDVYGYMLGTSLEKVD